MTVKVTQPKINLREEISSVRSEFGSMAYQDNDDVSVSKLSIQKDNSNGNYQQGFIDYGNAGAYFRATVDNIYIGETREIVTFTRAPFHNHIEASMSAYNGRVHDAVFVGYQSIPQYVSFNKYSNTGGFDFEMVDKGDGVYTLQVTVSSPNAYIPFIEVNFKCQTSNYVFHI